MGLPAQRISRDQLPPEGAIAVAGQFVDLDEGDRLKRMAIGFRQGQSSVSAAVQLYHVTGARSAGELLGFTATGTSSAASGAAVTMGAGAAVQVAAAATAGAKEFRDTSPPTPAALRRRRPQPAGLLRQADLDRSAERDPGQSVLTVARRRTPPLPASVHAGRAQHRARNLKGRSEDGTVNIGSCIGPPLQGWGNCVRVTQSFALG
ncbi:MAG: DUF4410 domain-containing protein [Candidatus Binatia bacterium]